MNILRTLIKEIYRGALVGGQLVLLVVVAIGSVAAIIFGIFGFLFMSIDQFCDGNTILGIIMSILTVTVWGLMINNTDSISRWFETLDEWKIFKGIE